MGHRAQRLLDRIRVAAKLARVAVAVAALCLLPQGIAAQSDTDPDVQLLADPAAVPAEFRSTDPAREPVRTDPDLVLNWVETIRVRDRGFFRRVFTGSYCSENGTAQLQQRAGCTTETALNLLESLALRQKVTTEAARQAMDLQTVNYAVSLDEAQAENDRLQREVSALSARLEQMEEQLARLTSENVARSEALEARDADLKALRSNYQYVTAAYRDLTTRLRGRADAVQSNR